MDSWQIHGKTPVSFACAATYLLFPYHQKLYPYKNLLFLTPVHFQVCSLLVFQTGVWHTALMSMDAKNKTRSNSKLYSLCTQTDAGSQMHKTMLFPGQLCAHYVTNYMVQMQLEGA